MRAGDAVASARPRLRGEISESAWLVVTRRRDPPCARHGARSCGGDRGDVARQRDLTSVERGVHGVLECFAGSSPACFADSSSESRIATTSEPRRDREPWWFLRPTTDRAARGRRRRRRAGSAGGRGTASDATTAPAGTPSDARSRGRRSAYGRAPSTARGAGFGLALQLLLDRSCFVSADRIVHRPETTVESSPDATTGSYGPGPKRGSPCVVATSLGRAKRTRTDPHAGARVGPDRASGPGAVQREEIAPGRGYFTPPIVQSIGVRALTKVWMSSMCR